MEERKPETKHRGFIKLWKRWICIGRDSSVGIKTRYWLDSLRMKSRWGEISHTLPDGLWSPPTMGTGSLSRAVKRTERGVHHPTPHLVPRLKKEQSYTYILPLDIHGLFGWILRLREESVRQRLDDWQLQGTERRPYENGLPLRSTVDKSFISILIIIIIIIIIIIYLSCWPIPVSRIQKSLQRSTMIPSPNWGVVFHYPG